MKWRETTLKQIGLSLCSRKHRLPWLKNFYIFQNANAKFEKKILIVDLMYKEARVRSIDQLTWLWEPHWTTLPLISLWNKSKPHILYNRYSTGIIPHNLSELNPTTLLNHSLEQADMPRHAAVACLRMACVATHEFSFPSPTCLTSVCLIPL